jgi:flagellar biosynthetic protein FliR
VNGDDAATLAALPGLAFACAMILARAGAAIMLLPGLGEASLPAMLRAGIALMLTVLLVPVVAPSMPPIPGDALHLAAMVGAELLTGLWLGWLAWLLVQALPIAGQIVSYLVGVSNVLQPDPVLGAEATAVSRMLSLLATLVVLVSGLWTMPVAAIASSFHVIPPGTFLPAADTTETVLQAVAQTFELALRLSSPFILASIVWHLALGVIARLVPRVQVYFVTMPGQILGGVALLGLLAGGMVAVWEEALRDAYAHLPGL